MPNGEQAFSKERFEQTLANENVRIFGKYSRILGNKGNKEVQINLIKYKNLVVQKYNEFEMNRAKYFLLSKLVKFVELAEW